MKKLLPVLFLAFAGVASAQTTHTVTNVGFTYSPDTLYVTIGDSVDFALTSSIHNAVEVTQSTWLANGTTSNGGFVVPFGGGTVKISTAGTHYYVCQNHAPTAGMKAVIIAVDPNGVQETELLTAVKAYPTRVTDMLTVQVDISQPVPMEIAIYNILGELVYTLPATGPVSGKNTYMIDFTSFRSGPYFVKVMTGNEVKTIRVLK
jgi:plastocyanin